MSSSTQKLIVSTIEKLIGITVVDIKIPKQGVDSEVIIINDISGKEFAVKFSRESANDVLAFNLIKENNIDIPIPKLITHFSFEDNTVLVMEKINFPLLEAASSKQVYIPSMIAHLKKLHTIKSNKVGMLSNQDNLKSWKELLLYKYSGQHPWFNWNKIAHRDGVDTELILKSVNLMRNKIEKHAFINKNYSLLHTDFNQRNLFVDLNSEKITAIIDWTEAMFGDPLFDFARVRMFIWHFNLQNEALEKYFSLLSLTEEEIELEELYLVSQILDYITWYSEVRNDFNDERLKRHQEFLEDYKW